MIALIQRVTRASVTVEGEVTGEILSLIHISEPTRPY